METVIESNSLCLGYKRDELVIRNATFSINEGDFVFITGGSGSGKSTLIRSVYGSLPPASGGLVVNGFNIKKIRSRSLLALRRSVGIVFQDYKLIEEWSVERNIAFPMVINGFPRADIRIQTERLLSHINLLHKANKKPIELSGGEQQRVALARAISHGPNLILCDEPTGNLDDYSSDMIWGLLRSSNEQLGVTVVVVTHRLPDRLNLKYRRIKIQDGSVHERA